MKLLITDTNVFFDIISIQALTEFFKLDFEICTIDLVVHEILDTNQKEEIEKFIKSKKLTIFKLTSEEVIEVAKFKTKRKFKGIVDIAVLWKALQLKCRLLTGDKNIRREAEEQGLEVGGSIWVIKMFFEQKQINANKGIGLLEKLAIVNDRIPKEEIDKLIKQLKK